MLRAAGGTVGFAAAASVGGMSALASAAPTRANHPIVLWWLADTGLPNNSVGIDILKEATAPFVAANKGITLRPGFMIGNGVIPEIVSGNGPDIVADWYAAPYWVGNLLLPLDDYIKRDNINTTVWSKGQWAVMQQPFGTYMLPAYLSPMVYFVRLSDFDEIGLEYPNPNWTHTEFVDIARKLTIRNSKKTRYGTDAEWHNNTIGGESWLFQAFGGNLMNADGTQQTLSDPGSIAGAEWVYEELLWPGVGCQRDQFYGATGIDGLLADQQSMRVTWGNEMLVNAASHIRGQFKWDVYPAPIFPKGRMTQGTEDFYGINVQTKHPDQAWELLKYLSYNPAFTRFLMGVDAQTPAIVSLWPEWQATVENMAPPLRGKSLHWYTDAVLNGYAISGQYFRYGDPQVRAIDNPWIQKLYNRQTDVASAFHQADHQANAFLAQAEAAVQQQAKIANLLVSGQTQSITFPSPTAAGPVGTVGIKSPAMVTVKNGAYTVQAAGQGLNTNGSDGTFFCAPSTASRATFTVRLTSIANVDLPSMPDGAKIGLVAKGDLTDQGAAVGAIIATGRGFKGYAQSIPGGGYGDQGGWRAGGSSAVTGLVPASTFLQADASKQSNYLIKPIWLRLVRDDRTWTALSSFDGVHWTPTVPNLGMNAAGVWIGLFVSAHDGKLGVSGKRISATFDHITGFAPQAAYVIGSQ